MVQQLIVFAPEEIFIERGAEDTAIADRCRERLPDLPITVIDDRRELAARFRSDFAASKRVLLLARRKGAFLEHCPAGTRGLACCNYLVVNFASNCPMDCR